MTQLATFLQTLVRTLAPATVFKSGNMSLQRIRLLGEYDEKSQKGDKHSEKRRPTLHLLARQAKSQIKT